MSHWPIKKWTTSSVPLGTGNRSSWTRAGKRGLRGPPCAYCCSTLCVAAVLLNFFMGKETAHLIYKKPTTSCECNWNSGLILISPAVTFTDKDRVLHSCWDVAVVDSEVGAGVKHLFHWRSSCMGISDLNCREFTCKISSLQTCAYPLWSPLPRLRSCLHVLGFR